MSKIAEVRYNGEIGFKAKIKDVITFLKILIPIEEFLNFTNENGVKNRQIILNSYDSVTKLNFNLKKEGSVNDNEDAVDRINGDMPCPNPITFFVSVSDITVDILVNQSSLLISDDSSGEFSNDESKKVGVKVRANNFFANFIVPKKSNFNPETNIHPSFRENPIPQVWIWCKSLNPDQEFNENSIFDLSNFITNFSTNQTETGGNFSIDLEAIEGFVKIEDGEIKSVWSPSKSNYIQYNINSKANFFFRKFLEKKGIFNQEVGAEVNNFFNRIELNNVKYRDTVLSDVDTTSYIRTQDFFKNLISENDVIFISFDKDDVPYELEDDFFVNHRFLKGKDWDMIGLIDTNGTSTNFENSTQSISITGRDCMKLLIEDGSYFFAKSYAHPDNSEGVFFNVKVPNSGDAVNALNTRKETSSRGINRLITSGMIDMLFNPEARNIQFIMNLLISRLSNIEICHSDLFRFYGDEVTKFAIPFTETIEEDDNSINTSDGD